jgi:hypothetical protein
MLIVFQIPGISADILWDALSINFKERIVSQVAEHLKATFPLRFHRAGSLYLSSPSPSAVHVGPIVSMLFYRALDSVVMRSSYHFLTILTTAGLFRTPLITSRVSYSLNFMSSPTIVPLYCQRSTRQMGHLWIFELELWYWGT